MPATLSELRGSAARFNIKGLVIETVGECSARILVPREKNRDLDRRNFWTWLFGELYDATFPVAPASCTFLIRKRGPELPLTWFEKLKKFCRLDVPPRYGSDVWTKVELRSISLENRNRLAIQLKGAVSFMVSEKEVVQLQDLGISNRKMGAPYVGWYQVVMPSVQIESITLCLVHIDLLWAG